MANELVEAVESTVLAATDGITPNYNKKVGEKVLALTIKCKMVKAEKNEFNSVKLYKYLPAYDKDGNALGKVNRWIDLHFIKDAFKGVPADCDVHSAEDLMTGILYVKAKAVQSPRVYKIVYDEKTGEYVYPEAWINKPNCIVGFEPYVSDQDDFNYHEAPIEAKQEESQPWDND